MTKHILVVEDEFHLRRMLTIALQAEGFVCTGAETARQAIVSILDTQPNLIILDLGLPDQEGISVLSRVRQDSGVPVLVLSARDAQASKIELLNAGANDYVSKPFGIGELIARINVLLRDAHHVTPANPHIRSLGRLKIAPANNQVWIDGLPVTLTNKEFSMLEVLTRKPGQLFSQQQLLREIWGNYHKQDNHYLRILLSQLRKKLNDEPNAPEYIETIAGKGYRFINNKVE
ncbi:response regulator transcription factor [Salinimonas sp. HHU 13199]|uniref:Response regulator transcription factor n=1 Tax=Salinimonas profundi TaxID=2729140 RepID=A0ABR8LK55_9ALTE|nr:response regulator transcription factor [Salinimonas profundi]MBD3585953.1 response regulator transcription factor [Salinimonas profundi]